MSNCPKSSWAWSYLSLKKVILPCKAYKFQSVGSNFKSREMQMLKQEVRKQQQEENVKDWKD